MRSTLDPLTLTPLRNAVIHSAWGRGKIDLPPGIAKKLDDTRVFVGNDIRESRFRKDLAKSMRVERVSDKARNQKFKVRDERQESQQADNGRTQEIARLNAEATKDNKEADRQVRKLGKEDRKGEVKATRVQEKSAPKAQPQPQAVKVGNPAKPEPKQRSQKASKQELKQKAPKPDGHGHEAGKGKRKKP